jgi:hypothetical protein
MEKEDYFNKEYKYIKNKNNIKDLKFLVNLLPDYFFEIPASSTGKYHPNYAQGKQGLIRHTKAAVRIAVELFNDESICKFSIEDQDLIIMALILHDGLKSGNPEEKYTRADHPLLVSRMIMEQKDKLSLDIDSLRKVCSMIESHMGPWNIDYKTKEEILPRPKTAQERFVHMCDYLASKKIFEVPFDGIEVKY